MVEYLLVFQENRFLYVVNQNMRDSEIYRRMENDSRSLKLALRQIGFIDMRLQAFESVIKSRWAIIQLLINPSKFIAKINKKHLEFLKQHDDDLMKMREEAKKEALKPKLLMPISNGNGNNHG